MRKIVLLLIFFSSLFFLSSCSKKSDPKRIYLKNFEYSDTGINGKFNPVENNLQLRKLHSFTKNRCGYVWLKTTFEIPDELKNEDLYIYLGTIKIASKVYINYNFIGLSGDFPPHEFSYGENPSYYPISPYLLNKNGENTVEILVWVDTFGTMDDSPFIGTASDVLSLYKEISYSKSKISFIEFYIMILISFIYFILFHFKTSEHANLSFSLLNFFSAFYMVTMGISEFPKIIPPQYFSYLSYLKLFLGIIAVITSYFAVSFIRDYLGAKDSHYRKIYRRSITIIPCIAIITSPNLKTFVIALGFSYLLMGIHILYAARIILNCFKEKNKKIWSLLVGFLPILLSLLGELSVLILKHRPNKLIVVLGWQMTLLMFVVILIIKFGRMENQIEYLNNNLEKLVEKRTNELQQTNNLLEETNTQLQYEKSRSEREFELASQVQESFYQITIPELKDFEFEYYFKPLLGVSGDLYEIFFNHDKLDGFGIFDVSGHGIASGLVTMLVKNIIHQEFYQGNNLPLEDVIDIINNRVTEEKGNIENYLTGILARVTSPNKIEFVNAGHPSPLLYNKQLETVLELPHMENTYGMIGIADLPTAFKSQELHIQKDDSILLYTDGIIEARNSEDEPYGLKRLSNIFQQIQNKTVKEQIESILYDVKQFVQSEKIDDDITMMIIRRK